MLIKSQIQAAIGELGLSARPVSMHTSLRSFGSIDGGADAIIDAFLECDCTLLVPTFSDDFAIDPPATLRPERNGWDYGQVVWGQHVGVGRVYTIESNETTVEEMGHFPAAVLQRDGRVRGEHPLCSFAALGPLATGLIAGQNPQDVFAPLRQLCALDGRVLLMGVGLNRMSLLHAAEEAAGRRPFVRWANGPDGAPIAVRIGGCSEGFERLRDALEPFGKTQIVGQSKWQAFPAHQILQRASEIICRRPEITHCRDAECGRCDDQILGGPIGQGGVSLNREF